MPQIVWSGDENDISRPVCESATSTCKYHGVGIYVCYIPTRFVGRREVGVRRRRDFPDLTAYISRRNLTPDAYSVVSLYVLTSSDSLL